MASVKGKLVRWFGGLVLTRARVDEVTAPAPSFRRIVLRGDTLAAADWQPGDKVQLLLSTDETRTYTPVHLGGDRVALLGWCDAGGPGARWVSTVAVGDDLAFLGPQRSLRVPDGDVVVVGDETCVALAATFGARLVASVLVAHDSEATTAACDAMGLTRRSLLPPGDTARLTTALREVHAAHPGATFAVAGGSELIVTARRVLRAHGVSPRVKTYWAPGKSGLD